MQVVRRRHARRRGGRLRNTSPTEPRDRDTLGKLRVIPDRGGLVENPHLEKGPEAMVGHPPEDGGAAHQVVGGVTAHLAYDGYGRWEAEPGEGH